jgi:hypothetical protein
MENLTRLFLPWATISKEKKRKAMFQSIQYMPMRNVVNKKCDNQKINS